MQDHETSSGGLSLELLATVLGAGVGLVAAAPLVWLTIEAQRTGNPTLSRSAGFYLWELGGLWLGGALTGGWLAALLSRSLLRQAVQARTPAGGASGLRMSGRLLHLLLGTIIIMVLAPAPAALVMAAAYRQAAALVDFYLIGGGLIGWQAGVIAFVFLYTFRTLEARRNLPGTNETPLSTGGNVQ